MQHLTAGGASCGQMMLEHEMAAVDVRAAERFPDPAPARPTVTRGQAQDDAALAERALLIARRTALGVLADAAAADDVAQEVAIVALRRRASLRHPASLDAWLHRIAVRAALRHAKKASRRRDVEAAAPRAAAAHEHDGRTQAAEAAAALLATLPPRQRAALTLRYVHDLSDDAIASALGCRTGTVRSLLSRGREALREAKEDDR